MIHSATPQFFIQYWRFVLLHLIVEMWNRRTFVRKTRENIVITAGRDYGSDLWINRTDINNDPLDQPYLLQK